MTVHSPLAVVELWGGSDPQPLVQTIAAGEVDARGMDELAQIIGVVAAVDPARLIPDLSKDDLLSERGLHTSADED